MIKFWSKFHIEIFRYSFTRDKKFLLTPSHFLPGKQEKIPLTPLNTLTTALVCIFSSILNSVMEGWKYRSKELLKAIFCHQKNNNKKADRLYMKFSSTLNTNVQRCLNPLLQNQRRHFLLVHLFRRMSQPSSQLLNEHMVDYHPSPSEFTSRIHPVIFLWTAKGFISPEYFLIFFLKLVYLTMVEKNASKSWY